MQVTRQNRKKKYNYWAGGIAVPSLPKDDRPLRIYTGLDPVLRSGFSSLLDICGAFVFSAIRIYVLLPIDFLLRRFLSLDTICNKEALL
jgi:hypothetical protein